jgi:hypothetical protein
LAAFSIERREPAPNKSSVRCLDRREGLLIETLGRAMNVGDDGISGTARNSRPARDGHVTVHDGTTPRWRSSSRSALISAACCWSALCRVSRRRRQRRRSVEAPIAQPLAPT